MSANPRLPKATRAERAAEAARLKAEGLNGVQIAGALGVSTSYVSALLRDPTGDGDRARKRGYAGTCADCGAPTNYAVGGPSERCRPCAAARTGAERKVWTREALIAAIRAWADEHGEPPAMPDWNPWQARANGQPARAERFERAAGRWPSFTTVVDTFGRWSAGIEAAGFTPRKVGRPRREAVAA